MELLRSMIRGSMERRFGRMSARALVCALLIGAHAGCNHAPSVVFEGPEGIRATFRVEVADTVQERRRGLMYRRELRTDEGMLFVFPARRISRSG